MVRCMVGWLVGVDEGFGMGGLFGVCGGGSVFLVRVGCLGDGRWGVGGWEDWRGEGGFGVR